MKKMKPSNFLHASVICFLLLNAFLATDIVGQTQVITTPDGQTITVDASQMANGALPQQIEAARAMRASKGQPLTPETPGEGNPAATPGTPDPNAPPGAVKPAEAENVKRTNEPPEPANPDELNVKPDEDGLLRFQFRNQPWPEVVRWLASVSNLSLDWQELPGDYINLATQRPFTIEETTDMINRAMLSRGFTLLVHEGVLLVAKIETLNPAMVPRVRPEELANIPPHSFVRTSFPLTWLMADEVSQEFGSMISKNGKLTALASTNRLEAIDAAANLRDIYEILEQEQSAVALENLAREFILDHARASSVKLQVEEFMGINNSSSSGSRGSGGSGDAMRQMQQQMAQQMQQMQQQMQQAQQGGGAKRASARPRSEDMYIVANDRSNSVIVHASPDKMAIIASFIARVDVPNENAADFQRMSTRMKVFRLASLSPSELVASLTAMDVLEPTTRLQVDETNNAIIAYASVADQYLIQSVVERLDGSERTFEVIQLRRLDAEAVAGSIKFLMGAEEEDESSSSRNRNYGFYDYYGGYGGSSKKEKKSDKMRVGANVQDNQVLLWANPTEMDEVENLLVKLGEIPPEGGRRSTTRVIDASRQPETFEYLKRLKEQWERVSPNPLQIPDASEFVDPDGKLKDELEKTLEKVPQQADGEAKPSPADDTLTRTSPFVTDEKLVSSLIPQTGDADTRPSSVASVPNQVATATPQPETPKQDPPQRETRQSRGDPEASMQPPADPIKIEIDEAGNLIINSNDTSALDRLEDIMMSNRPPRKPYDIFKVKYARASWVVLNLQDYFDNKEEDSNDRFFRFFSGESQKNDDEQLGKKLPLRFIYDNDTFSIVVQGADDLDRKTIKELIDLWDVPEPEDEEDTDRYTKLLPVKYSRADAIVNTIKEAYRDLLSATDKSVQPQQGEGQGEAQGEDKRSGGGGAVQPSGGMSYSFKGKLSLGVDNITNSILISAEGEQLMKIIADMITQLDEAAKPQGHVEVYKLGANVSGKSLEAALRSLLQSPGGQAKGKAPNQGQQKNGGEAVQQQAVIAE